MEQAPKGIRYSITLVGRTNAGKSALINAICDQEVAIVSDVAGTTTDSIYKTYELIGFGPVVFYDTAGLEDHSELGEARMKATFKTLRNSDMALVVIGDGKMSPEDEGIIEKIKSFNIPYLVVYNKMDLFPDANGFKVSAKQKTNIDELKQKIIATIPPKEDKTLLHGLVNAGDKVVLVAPIDTAAPQGRLILPQVMVLREILDANAIAIVVQPEELKETVKMNPKLVITDSQAFSKVVKDIPQDMPLTSFSIILGRGKGDFNQMLQGAKDIDKLKDGDKILIAEACSHITTMDDIARQQLPKLMEKYTGKKLEFEFTQGRHFPDDLNKYALVLHCGSCMLTQKETQNRLDECAQINIPVTNYGMTFAKCQGILDRVVDMM